MGQHPHPRRGLELSWASQLRVEEVLDVPCGDAEVQALHHRTVTNSIVYYHDTLRWDAKVQALHHGTVSDDLVSNHSTRCLAVRWYYLMHASG